ncbi:unnamed protein product, partial [Polarella glacialis]
HDAGPSGFQGRSLAERKVQDFIADARATASAATAATASAEPWPDQASVATDWNKDASQWHDDRKPTSRQGSSGLRSREGQDTGRWSGSSDEKGGNDKNKDNAWDQWTDQKDLGNTWKADSSGAGSGWDARSEGNSSTWGRTAARSDPRRTAPASIASADDTKAAWANWNPSSTEAKSSGWNDRGSGGGGGDVRPGDWACGKCGANIFASKVECFKCGTPKEGGGGRDKDWNDRGSGGGSRW